LDRLIRSTNPGSGSQIRAELLGKGKPIHAGDVGHERGSGQATEAFNAQKQFYLLTEELRSQEADQTVEVFLLCLQAIGLIEQRTYLDHRQRRQVEISDFLGRHIDVGFLLHYPDLQIQVNEILKENEKVSALLTFESFDRCS